MRVALEVDRPGPDGNAQQIRIDWSLALTRRFVAAAPVGSYSSLRSCDSRVPPNNNCRGPVGVSFAASALHRLSGPVMIAANRIAR